MGISIEDFLEWNRQALKYPPSEIFFGEEQTPRMSKAEKRLKGLCDSWLFSFGDKSKNDFRTALWDLTVMINLMSDKPGIRVCNSYIASVINTYFSKYNLFMGNLEAMMKSDQILQDYYKGWRLPRRDFIDFIMVFAYNYSDDRADLNNHFKNKQG